MNTNFEKQYLEQCRALIMSVRMKFAVFADTLNAEVIAAHGVDSVDLGDQTTWAYYMHLAGQYHPQYDQTVMEVISLDTQETIDFTKENLEIHTATKKAYGYGNRYYYALVDKYPLNEELILGILYPCDINEAINAPDGRILTYDASLVEQQEYRLIDELQSFVDGYLSRWFLNAFHIANGYYSTASYTIVYLSMLQKLFSLRIKACKTPYAHSFYIREYFKSNGGLDIYIPYMTTSQIAFIYRNLLRLRYHVGKVERFNQLLQKLLTDRQIPLSEFSVRQLSEFNQNWYSTVTVRSKPLNPETNEKLTNYYTLDELALIEEKTLPTNALYYDAQKGVVEKKLQNAPSSVIQTKALYSAMIDYQSDGPDNIEKIMLRQWIHLVSLEYMGQSGTVKPFYSAFVNFKLPGSADLKTLSAKNALIYYIYLTHAAAKLPLSQFSDIYVQRQRKLVKPSYSELVSKVDTVTYPVLKKWTQDAIDGHANYPMSVNGVYGINSVDAFLKLGTTTYNESIRESQTLGLMDSVDKKGMLTHVYDSFYEDKVYLFSPPDNLDYSTWLALNSLPTVFAVESERTDLIKELFEKSTGYVVDTTKKLSNIQSAMIGMMAQLSSYSIVFHKDINEQALVYSGLEATNVDLSKISRSKLTQIDSPYDVLYVSIASAKSFPVPADDNICIDYGVNKMSRHFDIPFDTYEGHAVASKQTYSIISDDFILDAVDYNRVDPITGTAELYNGQTYYDRLSPEVKLALLTKLSNIQS